MLDFNSSFLFFQKFSSSLSSNYCTFISSSTKHLFCTKDFKFSKVPNPQSLCSPLQIEQTLTLKFFFANSITCLALILSSFSDKLVDIFNCFDDEAFLSTTQDMNYVAHFFCLQLLHKICSTRIIQSFQVCKQQGSLRDLRARYLFSQLLLSFQLRKQNIDQQVYLSHQRAQHLYSVKLLRCRLEISDQLASTLSCNLLGQTSRLQTQPPRKRTYSISFSTCLYYQLCQCPIINQSVISQTNKISMQTEEFDELLVEIKYFLAKNTHLEGAFNLLARLDSFLSMKLKKQISGNGDELEIILDSEDEQPLIVQPRKFASILDIFILQYNFQQQAYQVIPLSPTTKSQQIESNRGAINELILSPLKQHVSQKQKTNSMTQLHKLTANVPKTNPPLILPNYSQQPFKYIYIYQSKQCMQYQDKYYLVDRYSCFVVDGLANECVDMLYKDMRNRIFQERIMRVNDSIQVNYKFVRECFLSTIPLLVDKVNQFPVQLGDPVSCAWTEQQKQYYFAQIKTPLISPLVLLATYFALCQYKVILISSKDEKYKLSDVMISVQGALQPLKYIYPVVFCTLSGNHCDFVESPVPLTIGFWGNDRRRVKFEQKLKHYLINQLKGIPTILIDLQKNTLRYSSGVTNSDVYIISKMNTFIHKYSKGACLYKKISCFLQEILEDIKNNKKQNSQWLALLHNRIKNSQMFHHQDKK